MPIISKEAWRKNSRIALLLAVCYVLGMMAAYQTTQLLVRWRGDRRQAVSPQLASPQNSRDLNSRDLLSNAGDSQ